MLVRRNVFLSLIFPLLFFYGRCEEEENHQPAGPTSPPSLPPDCDCPGVIRPVCGTDNVTYSNLCILRCIQRTNRDLLFFYNGTCCDQAECENGGTPLCDNFGKTHANNCRFKHIQCVMERSMGLSMLKIHDGSCSLKDCNHNCTHTSFDPVCDTNGSVYRNLCVFQMRRCELQLEGQQIQLAEDRKFCLRNRETHRFKLAGVESYSSYAEEPYVDSTTRSPEATLPERTTVVPEGFLNKAIVKTAPTPLANQSPLTRNDLNRVCSIIECDKSWDPVCDTRNRTHKNVCQFKFFACKINKIDGSIIDIAHTGACKARKSTCITCPKDEKRIPICDNQNMTHPDLCSFIQFNCDARNNNEEERVLVHVKPCHSRSPQFALKVEMCPRTCSRDVKPVCDEANNTHQNLCHFQQYNCNMRKLGIRSPYLRYLRPCVKNRKIDTAVENVEMRASVSNVEVKIGKSEASVTPSKPSEKTTFIVSALEKVMKSTTSTSTPVTTTTTTTRPTMTTTQTVSDAPSTTTVIPTTTATATTTEEPFPDVAFFDCPKPNCPTDGQPVCDSAGNLHGNLCEFTYSRCLAASKGHQIHIATEENCISKEACEMPCTEDKHPICASDFLTYENLCQFRKQKCLDAELEVLFKGKCNECLDSPCALPAENSPDEAFVCLEDQSTKSLCEYQMLSCIFERGYGVNLTVQYIGTCCPPVESCDTEKPDPVCTDSGATFLTECELKIENCKLKKLDQPKLEIVSQGICEKDLLTDDFSSNRNFQKPNIEFKRENSFNCSMECDNSYDPLCGTNGITYTNACSLQKEICNAENSSTIEIAYTGMCCDTNCPSDFSPVCDSKGNTHQNICHFGIKRCIAERTFGDVLTIEKFEVCNEIQACNAQCPKEYSPVCASNQQNIVNECELNKIRCLVENNVTTGEKLVKEYDGECCRLENCDFSAFSPVCDTEGITHANMCLMNHNACIQLKKFKKTIQVSYQGQCCNQPCDEDDSPVCDGTFTHSNTCKFRISQCEAERVNKTLSIAYNGECCVLPKGECETSGAVCDSEGQTHANHCVYQQKRCIAQRITLKTLNIVHTGECCALASCPKTGQPVCDSQGRTHDSLCHFHNSKCIFDKIHTQNTTLTLDYQGKCCPAGCTDELSVICDQHENIYRNSCYFNLKACETWRRTQDVLLATPCPLLRT
ncbi:hypothetical protein L3Y34_011025 [Caenorhabditis briggsae]|uniref:Kazal-like domain-containing protein n=1 Tax=Caenorhabditis briggsae TaxID=6238 RepID=A0AAE8ZNY4_CAEBR|nr:hypothetical protein L3Y34_011025 [Caenorhabditis briggsae]